MKGKSLLVVAAVLVAFFSLTAYLKAAERTPTTAIKELDEKLDDYKTGPNLSEADKEYNKKIKKDILHGTFDIKELSRLALDKHWYPRTYPERKQFIELMTDLLENKAILSKEQGQKKAKTERVYVIRYLGDKYLNQDKTRALTRTNVYVKSEDINVKLDYRLRKDGEEWKVYDVIMDGASLVDNYKYQFDRIITKNDYNELVSRMNKKLEEIKKDNGDDGKV